MLRLRDDVRDVLIELSARRARALLLLVSIALSAGVLVASYTVSIAAARQVDAGFVAAGSTTFTVGARASEDNGESAPMSVFPPDTESRAQRVDLVRAAGRRVDIARAESRPRRGAASPDIAEVDVLGATSGYLAADRAVTGGAPAWLLDGVRAPAVALVGERAAERLGRPQGVPGPGVAVWVADTRFSVIGRITGSTDDTLANAVVIPHSAALAIDGVSDFQTVVLVRTDLGGGGPVSRVIRIAIRPDRPESLATSPVADFSSLRQGVGSELTRLTAAVGFLLLAVATLLIANAMIVSVVSRTAEIGLRRSMGASQRGIARIFVIEGGLLGVLGGLVGSASGMAVSLAIAAMNRWDTTQPLLAVFVGPAVGLAAGLLASAYPSWRAATTLPAEAMRAD